MSKNTPTFMSPNYFQNLYDKSANKWSLNHQLQDTLIQCASQIPDNPLNINVLTKYVIAYFGILTSQTQPYLESMGLLPYAKRNETNILNTSPLFCKYDGKFPENLKTELADLLNFALDTLQPIPELAVIPPFPSGLFNLSDQQDMFYKTLWQQKGRIAFEITIAAKTDTPKKETIYRYLTRFQLTITIPTTLKSSVFTMTKIKHEQSTSQLYAGLDLDDIHWNLMDRTIFLDICENIDTYETKTYASLFLTNVLVVNAMLYQNTPKRQKSKKESQTNLIKAYLPASETSSTTVTNIVIQSKEDIHDTPVIQHKMTSDEPRIVHYQTPSWNVRGHIRRYKSGKTVYIKPTVRKRKHMGESDGHPKSAYLKFNPKKGEKS